jgi:hypothetical protein
MKTNTLLLVFFLIFNFVNAQPSIVWQRNFGGTGTEAARDIIQTSDGGYLIVGLTTSNDGDVSGNNGGLADIWVLKLNINGLIQWQKCLGGSSYDAAYSVIEISTGGYMIAGSTGSTDGDITFNPYNAPIWVIKLDNNGNKLWDKCYGGSNFEVAYSVRETNDGFIIGGYTQSNNGTVSGNHGLYDGWILKIDSLGFVQWQKCYGGSDEDRFYSLEKTFDGGYIAAGFSNSIDGNVSSNNGSWDFWIVKVANNGSIQWEKSYGGSSDDRANAIKQTADGGYIVVGETSSNDGDVIGNHPGQFGISWDFWILKLDSLGGLEWQKCLGGSGYEKARDVILADDGGYIIAGYTNSDDGDVSGNNLHPIWGPRDDFWIIKLDSIGSLEWQKCLGGTSSDEAYCIYQSNNNSIVIGGVTQSNDGDVTNYYGYGDLWVVKLSLPTSSKDRDINFDFSIFPNPSTGEVNISFTLKEAKEIKIELYNSLGQIVKTVSQQKFTSGNNQINFSTENLSKGIYHIKFSVGEDVVTRKLVKM